MMKKIIKLVSLLLFVSVFTNCGKENNKFEDARILGKDYRRCAYPFCGGYWIEVNQDTLRFFDFPKGSNLEILAEEKENLPLEVVVKWKQPEDEEMLRAEDLIVLRSIKEQ